MKKWIKMLLVLVLTLALVVSGYAIYVFTSSTRLPDRLQLDINGQAKQSLVTGKSYTIVTNNVGFGAYSASYSFFMDGGRYSRAYSKEEVIKNIHQASQQTKDADIQLFQEVDIDGTRSWHVNEAKQLSQTRKSMTRVFAQNYDSPYLFYPLNEPHGKNKSGMLTFSNFPIQSALRRSLPIDQGLSRILDLDRCYVKMVLPVHSGQSLVIYNVHLSAYSQESSTAVKQLRMLYQDMRKEKQAGHYVIAGGDFNKDLLESSAKVFGQHWKVEDNQWAKPLDKSQIPAGFKLWADDRHPSCRNASEPYSKKNMVLTVDGFIVSDNIEVEEVKTKDVGFAYSDHQPVTLTFELK